MTSSAYSGCGRRAVAASVVPVFRVLVAAFAVAVVALFGTSAAFANTTSWTTDVPQLCYSQIATDGSGNVYTPVYVTSGGWVVKEYTGNGVFLRIIGNNAPVALTGSPAGYIYIAYDHSIVRYSSAGQPAWGITFQAGFGNGQVSSITSIGADITGNIYILDGGADRVEKFSPTGSFITQWGSSGHGAGQFDLSDRGFLAVARDGTVFVADSDNRIQEFTTDGGFVTSWGSTGSAPGQFGRLSGITVDAAGHVYASDPGSGPGHPALQEFDSSGKLLGTAASGSEPTSTAPPVGIAAVATYGDDIVYAVGCQTVFRFELTVPDAGIYLSADLAGSALPVHVGSSVTAEIKASVPFGAIATYTFDFGDGTSGAFGPSATATHTYTTAGTYQVTARITSVRGGSATTSRTVTVVGPPVNSSAPSITGRTVEGQRLTEVHGTWSNGPISRYSYSWMRCDTAGRNCVAIRGAGSQTYVLATADVGRTIRVQESATNAIGMGTPAASGPTPIVRALPKLGSLSVTPRSFRAARTHRSTTTSPNVGTKVDYTLNVAATVRVTVEHVLDGRQVGDRCSAPSRKNRKARPCARYVVVRGSFTVSGRRGNNSFRFTGSVNGARLAPGKYRVIATPIANSRSGSNRTATFTILL